MQKFFLFRTSTYRSHKNSVTVTMNCSKFVVSRLLYHRTTPNSTSPLLSVIRFYTRSPILKLKYPRRLDPSPFSTSFLSGPLNRGRKFSSSAEQLKDKPDGARPEEESRNPAANTNSSPEAEANQHADDEMADITLKLTPEQVQELTSGDEELINKIKLIQMEHELARQDGARVPSKTIKFSKWKELLELKSRHQRMKYFNYLWTCQMGDEAAKRKKQAQREKYAAEIAALPPLPAPEEDPHGVFHALGRNSIFQRLYDSTQNRFHHNRLVAAAMFSQTIVIDCSYDEYMTRAESKNCAGQLEFLFTDNRIRAQEPLNIVMCNVDRKSKLMQTLEIRIPTLYEDNYMLQMFEQSYMDLFPKERLVYLTPHARDDLMKHNEDDIYIVGAMVDKSDPRPFSMAKAKKEGIRTAKLPLDHYLEWGGGSGKCLTVNQIGNILIDFNNTKDWNVAFRHVPTRKLRLPDDKFNPSDRYILQQPKRKERKSQVLQDFDVQTQSNRKGFGFRPSREPIHEELKRERFRPNMKSILSDD